MGVSVCVAGRYLLSSKSPTITAGVIAFNKQAILDAYKWPFVVLTLFQAICSGVAIYAGVRLAHIYKRERQDRERYDGRVVEAGKECKICLTNPCDVIFEPCKHMCCCKSCALEVQQCPMCRGEIAGRTDVFIS